MKLTDISVDSVYTKAMLSCVIQSHIYSIIRNQHDVNVLHQIRDVQLLHRGIPQTPGLFHTAEHHEKPLAGRGLPDQ